MTTDTLQTDEQQLCIESGRACQDGDDQVHAELVVPVEERPRRLVSDFCMVRHPRGTSRCLMSIRKGVATGRSICLTTAIVNTIGWRKAQERSIEEARHFNGHWLRLRVSIVRLHDQIARHTDARLRSSWRRATA